MFTYQLQSLRVTLAQFLFEVREFICQLSLGDQDGDPAANNGGLRMRIIALFLFLMSFLTTCVFTPAHLVGNKKDSFACFHDFYPNLTRPVYDSSKKECAVKEIDLSVYLALLATESDFNIFATSCKGAIGVGQVMPFHMPDNPDKLYDVDTNIAVSTKIFSQMIDRSNGNIAFALARYHAGPYKDLSKYQYWTTYVFGILQTARMTS